MADTSTYPKLGQTRCYWLLADAQLNCLFTDPVLTYHLKEQADPFIGTNFLDFIHPDERESASRDLRAVIQQRAIHGTVTRVKYLRLSQIRVVLGAAVKETFPHAKQVGYDPDYIYCDLVINWVADNLVLCFVHAIIDISPDDNDELLRTRWHWTNWCGTVPFTEEQSSLLTSRLICFTPPYSAFDNPPLTVFQILANSPARKLLFTWPPARGTGPGLLYDDTAFGNLASNVRIDSPATSATASPASATGAAASTSSAHANGSSAPSGQSRPHDPDSPYAEVKTSCTRRYRSSQSIVSPAPSTSSSAALASILGSSSNPSISAPTSIIQDVDSIFIPHGSVIFACHQVVASRPSSSPAPVISPTSHESGYVYGASGSGRKLQSEPWTLGPASQVHRASSSSQLLPPLSNPSASGSSSSLTPSSGSSNGGFPHTPGAIDGWMGSGPEKGPWPGYETHHHQHHHHQQTYPPHSQPDPQSFAQSQSWAGTGTSGYAAYDARSGNERDTYPTYDPYNSHQKFTIPVPSMDANGASGVLPPLSAIMDHSGMAGQQSMDIDPNTLTLRSQQQPYDYTQSGHDRNRDSDRTSAQQNGPIAMPLLPPPSALFPPNMPQRPEYDEYRQQPRHHFTQPPQSYGQDSMMMNFPPAQSQNNASSLSSTNPSASGPGPSLPPIFPAEKRKARSRTTSNVHSTGGSGAGASGSSGQSGTRVSGNPPAGVTHCAFCGTTSSPEWRKGVEGIKNLCNACGLRYARTKQKEEGHVPNRRRVIGASDIQAASGAVAPSNSDQEFVNPNNASLAPTGATGPPIGQQPQTIFQSSFQARNGTF